MLPQQRETTTEAKIKSRRTNGVDDEGRKVAVYCFCSCGDVCAMRSSDFVEPTSGCGWSEGSEWSHPRTRLDKTDDASQATGRCSDDGRERRADSRVIQR